MLSQPYATDIKDIVADDAVTVLAAGQRLAGGGAAARPASGVEGNPDAGAAARRTGAGRYVVMEAGGWFDLAGLARAFGEVPAGQYDPGYGSAGAADWYIPARESYSYGEPHSGELLIRFGR